MKRGSFDGVLTPPAEVVKVFVEVFRCPLPRVWVCPCGCKFEVVYGRGTVEPATLGISNQGRWRGDTWELTPGEPVSGVWVEPTIRERGKESAPYTAVESVEQIDGAVRRIPLPMAVIEHLLDSGLRAALTLVLRAPAA